jgi:general secretion pathway protein G
MRNKGFTLLEMVVTVAIVGLLATAAFPLAELGVRRAKEQDLRIALRTIRTGLDDYKAAANAGRIEMKVDDSGYPPTLDALVDGVIDIRSPSGEMMYFLRRVPRDPFYPDHSVTASDTWKLRAYDSDPHDPRAGDDVFDIRSAAPGEGMNGIPYANW